MADIITIGGRRVDPAQFLAQAIATARANLAFVQGSERAGALRQVAREALQEAHSSTQQAAFFACLDALGGQEVAIETIVQVVQALLEGGGEDD